VVATGWDWATGSVWVAGDVCAGACGCVRVAGEVCAGACGCVWVAGDVRVGACGRVDVAVVRGWPVVDSFSIAPPPVPV
jgi:hypothetical protein